MLPSDTTAAILPVVIVLDRMGVRYCIGGSVASSVYGLPRATLDVDLIAELAQDHTVPLVESLQADYYVSRSAVSEAIAKRSCFNVIHLATALKIDIFCSKGRKYDRAALGRTEQKPVDQAEPPTRFCFASPEDTILAKLEWYRLGDEVSDSQWRDVIGVMKVQGDRLDREYLATWAGELNVGDLLVRAWQEAEL